MKTNKQSNFTGLTEEKSELWAKSVDDDLRNVFLLAAGRVRFGDGTDGQDGENVAGQFQSFATAGADVETGVAHTIGAIPTGFLTTNINKNGVVYKGSTTWTDSTAYFKVSTGNAQVNVFLLK